MGGATATAVGMGGAWRGHPAKATPRGPGYGDEVVRQAPSLPFAFRRVRVVGWAVFPIALVLAVFANRSFAWIGPAAVVVMVGLNAFYFTAMQGMGEPLTLTKDGFLLGGRGRERSGRWVHVTDLVGAGP